MPSITRPILAAVAVVALSAAFFPRGLAQNAADAASPATNSQTADGISDDQIRRVGGPVSSPVLIESAAPKYSEEARAQQFEGPVVVSLIVDTQGVPQEVHVIRGGGHGLDENALEAIRHYRFKPAMLDGKPVPVRMNVEVNFRIVRKPESK